METKPKPFNENVVWPGIVSLSLVLLYFALYHFYMWYAIETTEYDGLYFGFANKIDRQYSLVRHGIKTIVSGTVLCFGLLVFYLRNYLLSMAFLMVLIICLGWLFM